MPVTADDYLALPEHKTCTKCGTQHPATMFSIAKDVAKKRLLSWCKPCCAARAKERRKADPEHERQIKRAYYATDKGKASKRREDAAYTASGGRARSEAKRATKPISEARLAARKRWAEQNKDYYTADRAYRRAIERNLDEFGKFVLREAVALSRIREQFTGFKWHVDHVVPITKGGTSNPDNIQVVPATWNIRKGNKHMQRYFGGN